MFDGVQTGTEIKNYTLYRCFRFQSDGNNRADVNMQGVCIPQGEYVTLCDELYSHSLSFKVSKRTWLVGCSKLINIASLLQINDLFYNMY